MKKLIMSCCQAVAIMLFLAAYSCKENSPDINVVTDKKPENVRLFEYSNSSITVAWDHIAGATSYTVQLLTTKDADKPIDRYIVIAEDFYRFDGLTETQGYYIRVRANVDYATGEWVYIMDGQTVGRIMPKYGFVAEDYEEPETAPGTELYPNFPEGWEIHDEGARKPSFTGVGPTGEQSDIFPSGEWLMEDIYSISTSSMVKNRIGDYALLFRGGTTPKLVMDFDLVQGASKLSFYYGAATQNATDSGGLPIFVKVEYSQDSGNTWVQLGDLLEVTSAEEQYYKEYELDIKGAVRFRIVKDNATASRLMVDEIAVYKN